MLVCAPVVAVVRRLVDLRLLLNGSVLAALSSAALWRERRAVTSCVHSTLLQFNYTRNCYKVRTVYGRGFENSIKTEVLTFS